MTRVPTRAVYILNSLNKNKNAINLYYCRDMRHECAVHYYNPKMNQEHRVIKSSINLCEYRTVCVYGAVAAVDGVEEEACCC